MTLHDAFVQQMAQDIQRSGKPKFEVSSGCAECESVILKVRRLEFLDQ